MNKEFKTDNFYLASYLAATGITLKRVQKQSSKKTHFIFYDTPKRPYYSEEFLFGESAPVNAVEFVSQIRRLKQLLHDA